MYKFASFFVSSYNNEYKFAKLPVPVKSSINLHVEFLGFSSLYVVV